MSEINEKISNKTQSEIFADLIKRYQHEKVKDVDKLDQIQQQLMKQLDLILFNNIQKSIFIFTKIQKFNDLMKMNVNRREKCESEMKKVVVENLELKEALAELEMKIRVSTNHVEKRNKK